MLSVWGHYRLAQCGNSITRVFCHFLWTRRKQLFLARESFSPSFRSIHHVAAISITIFEHQRRIEARRSGGSFGNKTSEQLGRCWEMIGRLTGECYRQKQRKFTSLTRLELVKPLSSPSRFLQIITSIVTDSPPSSLRASREIWSSSRCQLAPFLLCNAGQSMNSTRSIVYVTTVCGACAYLLPPYNS